MANGMFEAAAYQDFKEIDESGDYTNARFARTGDQEVGDPFPLYKQPAYYFTAYGSAGEASSNLRRQMNLPTNNTLFRNAQQELGVDLQNKQNNAWVFRTQTLANNGDIIACRNNTDCASWPGTTCNAQYSGWDSSFGNQGNYCATTLYPELKDGKYFRKSINDRGIGQGCNKDTDCAEGYFCNNETDVFGKNRQQTGYCAQTYTCPDGSNHFLGYPYNSGIPITPPPGQNNNGRGYRSVQECTTDKLAQQDCVRDDSGNWFATYPGYCPVATNLRSNNNPQGALATSSARTVDKGIVIPSFVNSKSSSIGSALGTLPAWSLNSEINTMHQMSSPLEYELSINPPMK